MTSLPSKLPPLLEPDALQAHLQDPNVLVVAVVKDQVYQALHIPGSVQLPPSALISGEPPATGALPNPERLETVFRELGLTPDTHVVAYDDEGGGWAGRLIWTLDLIGHPHSSYLNGGLHAWKAAGLPLETTPQQPTPSDFRLGALNDAVRMDAEAIRDHLDQADFAVWDARSPGEYDGSKQFAQRGGHIPGAINLEWTELMDPDRGLRIRNDAAEQLAAKGLTPDKTIVTHCQTHHRSGFTYLVAKLLGYPRIKAYPGSWSEWGNRADLPVETDA